MASLMEIPTAIRMYWTEASPLASFRNCLGNPNIPSSSRSPLGAIMILTLVVTERSI
jgi:hypothetical protein